VDWVASAELREGDIPCGHGKLRITSKWGATLGGRRIGGIVKRGMGFGKKRIEKKSVISYPFGELCRDGVEDSRGVPIFI